MTHTLATGLLHPERQMQIVCLRHSFSNDAEPLMRASNCSRSQMPCVCHVSYTLLNQIHCAHTHSLAQWLGVLARLTHHLATDLTLHNCTYGMVSLKLPLLLLLLAPQDAIGRKWQCSTIQLDFNLPARFDMTYIDAQTTKQRPIMIHRAIFGSIERFFGILIENYAGAFPLWLAPTQVRVDSLTLVAWFQLVRALALWLAPTQAC